MLIKLHAVFSPCEVSEQKELITKHKRKDEQEDVGEEDRKRWRMKECGKNFFKKECEEQEWM